MEDIIIKNYKTTNFKISKNDKLLCVCYVADSFWKRFKGLMLASPLEEGYGLLLPSTNSIHMFFMKYELDIIFLDKEYKVIDIIHSMKRRRVSKIYSNVKNVIELESGYLKKFDLNIGDILKEI